MQALKFLESPISTRHSSKVNSFQPSCSQQRFYQELGPCQPMIEPTGACRSVHLDALASDCAQAATFVHAHFHNTSSLYNDNTFVLDSNYTRSFLATHFEEKEIERGGIVRISEEAPCSFEEAASRKSRSPNQFESISPLSLVLTKDLPTSVPANHQYPTNPLTTWSFHVDINSMAAIESMPGTPPDLSESRSSKSSSLNSQFSVQDETSTEITNFEEIGLDDEQPVQPKNNNGEATQRRRRTQETTAPAPYYTRRPTLPDVRPSKQRASNGPRSATGSVLKRGFTSPSLTSFENDSTGRRSSSPPNRFVRSASTASFGGGSISPRSSIAPSSRRGSWQPRKTVKEIEAEYHDSDDDLPDDASLWNVPISPFPDNNHSALSSARGSPERRTSVSPQPLPLEHVKSAPEKMPKRMASAQNLSQRSRLTPRSSSYSLSRSNPNSPAALSAPWNNRTKSWTHAMSDLSSEARVVSQNLVAHAESQSREEKDRLFSGVSNRSSAPGAIQLPPIQRGPLDFMPISKEKEAILSRTRPSWLPPKDPKEEARHLKEYQKMMAASLEAEKKRGSKAKTTQFQRDDIEFRLNRIWDYYVEPSTDIVNIDSRVNDLCWRGISHRVRGKVWQRRIGNTLGLTKKTYHRALDRAKAIKAKDESDLSRQEKIMMTSFNDIERDAETAFPELGLFQREGPMRQDLIDLCEAHACYRVDIGYIYGIQLIGALLLIQVPDVADAFILLENALNSPMPLAFHTADLVKTQKTYSKVTSALAMKFPRLHNYLFEGSETGGLGLRAEEILEPMFRTMFSNGLDIDRLCRVWDLWMFEGDRVFIRTAVALLGSLQPQIMDVAGNPDLKRRNIQEMLGWGPFNRTAKGSYWQLNLLGDEDVFVDAIRTAGQLDYDCTRQL